MARRYKYEQIVIDITEWLRDELKHDAEVVNGIDEITDGTEDIVHGRYEVCRELLHYIRSLNGESHDNLDEGEIQKGLVLTRKVRDEKKTKFVVKLISKKDNQQGEWHE
jgi:hypothetical protein